MPTLLEIQMVNYKTLRSPLCVGYYPLTDILTTAAPHPVRRLSQVTIISQALIVVHPFVHLLHRPEEFPLT
jgi:hypothetical protein